MGCPKRVPLVRHHEQLRRRHGLHADRPGLAAGARVLDAQKMVPSVSLAGHVGDLRAGTLSADPLPSIQSMPAGDRLART
jgi:hypothetical protein